MSFQKRQFLLVDVSVKRRLSQDEPLWHSESKDTEKSSLRNAVVSTAIMLALICQQSSQACDDLRTVGLVTPPRTPRFRSTSLQKDTRLLKSCVGRSSFLAPPTSVLIYPASTLELPHDRRLWIAFVGAKCRLYVSPPCFHTVMAVYRRVWT